MTHNMETCVDCKKKRASVTAYWDEIKLKGNPQ